MQGILNTMLDVFDSVKAGGSYLILFFASLYLLYRVNAKKNQWYVYYALMSYVFVCINPLLVFVLSKVFPVLAAYSVFLLFTPILLFVPVAVAQIFEKVRDNKQAYRLLILLVFLIGVSGNMYGLYQRPGTEVLSYEEGQIEVVEFIKEEMPTMVVVDETLLPFLRTKAPEVSLLYGRDLYQPGMDLGIIDAYGEELLYLYEAMKNPADTISDILATADMYGCDMVIVKQFENAPESMGHFTKIADTEEYIVYSLQ